MVKVGVLVVYEGWFSHPVQLFSLITVITTFVPLYHMHSCTTSLLTYAGDKHCIFNIKIYSNHDQV